MWIWSPSAPAEWGLIYLFEVMVVCSHFILALLLVPLRSLRCLLLVIIEIVGGLRVFIIVSQLEMMPAEVFLFLFVQSGGLCDFPVSQQLPAGGLETWFSLIFDSSGAERIDCLPWLMGCLLGRVVNGVDGCLGLRVIPYGEMRLLIHLLH